MRRAFAIVMLWGMAGFLWAAEPIRNAYGDRVDENQVPVSDEEEMWSDWMANVNGPEGYNAYWRKMKALGLFSPFVEGRVFEGREEYRAIFRQIPGQPFYWMCYCGQSEETFTEKNELLTKLGYVCCSQQKFVSPEGEARIQATWIKNREAFKRDPRYSDKDGNIKEIDWKKYPDDAK